MVFGVVFSPLLGHRPWPSYTPTCELSIGGQRAGTNNLGRFGGLFLLEHLKTSWEARDDVNV